jgi:hypothetical protein
VTRADTVVGPPSDASVQVAEQLRARLDPVTDEAPGVASEALCTVAP